MDSYKLNDILEQESLWEKIFLGRKIEERFSIFEKNKSDAKHVFEYKYKKCIFDNQKCKLIIIREITDIANVEYARSLEKVSEVMVASTSHDMRTPLNTMTTMIKLVQKEV